MLGNAIQNRATHSNIKSGASDECPIGPDVSELSNIRSKLSSTASIYRSTVPIRDIRPAEAVKPKIQERRIEKEEQAQEEKYSLQAKTIIASAERARKEHRAKCVVV